MINHEPYKPRACVINKTDDNDYKDSDFMVFRPANSRKRDFIFDNSCLVANAFIRKMRFKARRAKK